MANMLDADGKNERMDCSYPDGTSRSFYDNELGPDRAEAHEKLIEEHCTWASNRNWAGHN
jgi:hypothetical protein